MKVLFSASLLLLASGLTAQTPEPIAFTGSVQLRSEADGRDFNHKTPPNLFSTMRTRLAATATFENLGKAVIEMQDTRTLGGEPSTLSNSPSFGAHQAYVLVPMTEGYALQAGRFEVAYGSERILGSVGWSMTSRSFDGFRLKTPLLGSLDFFALTVRENQAATSVPAWSAIKNQGSDLYGAWLTHAHESVTLEGFLLYESDNSPTVPIDRYTAGGTMVWKLQGTTLTTEGAWQTGTFKNMDIQAWMAAVNVAFSGLTGEGSLLTAGADLLSGTEAGSSEYNTFFVGYGTNHKFYGYMDYFLANPAGGVQDLYLKVKQDGLPWSLTGMADFHLMNSFEEMNGETGLGYEADFTLSRPIVKGMKLTAGASAFIPGPYMKALYASKDPAWWGYLQLNVSF